MVTRHVGQQKKVAFLEVFRNTGNVTVAARSSGVPRSTVYVWQERDDQFALAMREAEQEAIEILEAEARRRAFHGVERTKGVYHGGQLVGSETVREYSDVLLIFLLKGLKPERYRERFDMTSGGAPLPPLTIVVNEVPDRAR